MNYPIIIIHYLYHNKNYTLDILNNLIKNYKSLIDQQTIESYNIQNYVIPIPSDDERYSVLIDCINPELVPDTQYTKVMELIHKLNSTYSDYINKLDELNND